LFKVQIYLFLRLILFILIASSLYISARILSLILYIFANRHSSFKLCDRGRNSGNVVKLTSEHEILIEFLGTDGRGKTKEKRQCSINYLSRRWDFMVGTFYPLMVKFRKTLVGSLGSQATCYGLLRTHLRFILRICMYESTAITVKLNSNWISCLVFGGSDPRGDIEWAVQEINLSSWKLGEDRVVNLYWGLPTGLDLSWSDEPPNAKNEA
jgi:hypothetical protein